MIVDPDFLDHWRTQMLVDMLDDPCAPQYIIRLWGHCQNRRSWVFDGMPVQAAKAICRYLGDAEEFEKAMIDCGFLAREGDALTVVGWDEHNASLIANWSNGARGGRPKGSGKGTRKKPMGKPTENPSGNPQETDKIGCDEIGLDKANTPPKSPKGDSVSYDSWPELPEPQTLKDWITARKKAKGAHTQTAIDRIGKELHKAVAMGYTVEDCISLAATKTWRGFEAEWMRNAEGKPNFPASQQADYHGEGWADGFDPTADPFADILNGPGSPNH